MSDQSEPRSRGTLISIWCIPASQAPVIAIIARYRADGKKWNHLLRWKTDSAPESGAWATLSLVFHRCYLDSSGEFFAYHGKREHVAWDDPRPQHFRSANAGGYAVSRLPWLSALTHVEGCGAMDGGSGRSKHALSAPERAALWQQFLQFDSDEHWFLVQQPGWRLANTGEVDFPGDGEGFWKAIQEHPESRTRLLVRIPWKSSSGHVHLCEFFLQNGGDPYKPLTSIRWAHLDTHGTLRTVSKDGQLGEWQRSNAVADGTLTSSIPGWTLLASYDLSTLAPSPGPSPDWARAGLLLGFMKKLPSLAKQLYVRDRTNASIFADLHAELKEGPRWLSTGEWAFSALATVMQIACTRLLFSWDKPVAAWIWLAMVPINIATLAAAKWAVRQPMLGTGSLEVIGAYASIPLVLAAGLALHHFNLDWLVWTLLSLYLALSLGCLGILLMARRTRLR